jgi:hypothetical protein
LHAGNLKTANIYTEYVIFIACPLQQWLHEHASVFVKHTLPALFRSAVDGLKVGMQGGGEFRKQLIGGDYSITIVYPELRKQYTAIFGGQKDLKVCERVPDEKYR